MNRPKAALVLTCVLAVAAAALAAIDMAAPTTVSYGAIVTVDGSGFGTAPSAWLRGTANASLVKAKVVKVPAPTDSQFRFACPKAPAGDYSLEVAPKGVKPPMTLAGITVALPAIDALVPASGLPGAAAKVTGTKFGTKKGKLLFGAKKCKVTSWTDTEIQFVVPKLPLGAVDVAVTNTAGSSAPKAGGFTIAEPVAGGDVLTFDIGDDHLLGEATDSGQSFVGATRIVLVDSVRIVMHAQESKSGARTQLNFQFDVPNGAALPHTVTGAGVTIEFLRQAGFPLYPAEDYSASGGDVEIVIEAISETAVSGRYHGTLTRNALGTMGSTAVIDGTFTATFE